MSNLILQIFDIERFALHDGPGIRTVVFLQGCPLRCPWCANPESWTIQKKLMYIRARCVNCGRCASHCPSGALGMDLGRLAIDRSRCIGCGTCERLCPSRAIFLSGRGLAVDDILKVILKDREYYENSGGGVTVSGGEPFVQFEGLLELLKKLKKHGIHTAVETTGQVSPALFMRAKPYIDLFLYDYKHCDADNLNKVAGGDLPLISGNLAWLAKEAAEKIILRIPVIPGFNDTMEVIGSIFEMAAANGIKAVHILPYHTLGKGKFDQLGMEYPFDPDAAMLDKSKLEPYRIYGESMGLTVKIGG